MDQLLEQADPRSATLFYDIDSFLDRHRYSVAIYPIFPLIESVFECPRVQGNSISRLTNKWVRYCNKLDLPKYVFEDPSIRKLEALVSEIGLLYVPQPSL
jgi:hypothetical protein